MSCYSFVKNLKALKQNDNYRLELAKFIHKLHHGALPKMYDNFFNIFVVLILKKTDSLTAKIILCTGFPQILEKNTSIKGVALWAKIKQSLKTLPHVTFCKQYKGCLLS